MKRQIVEENPKIGKKILIDSASESGPLKMPPIPSRYVGHSLGSMNAPVIVEMFFDFVCPYSKKIFYKMQEVQKHYGEDKVRLVMINWIQPWHPQAYWLATTSEVVELIKPGNFWTMAKILYDHQDEFVDAQLPNLTKNQILSKLADLTCTFHYQNSLNQIIFH